MPIIFRIELRKVRQSRLSDSGRVTLDTEHKIKRIKNQKTGSVVFCNKSVLKNFAKFTGKHLYQSLLFNKVAGLRSATLSKKDTLTQVFSCEFCEIFKACVRYFLSNFYFSPNDSPSKTMKNVLYFI